MIILYGGNGFIGRHIAIRAHRSGRPGLVVAPRPDPDFLMLNAPSLSTMDVASFGGDAGQAALERATAFVHLASRSVPSSFVDAPEQELAGNVRPAFETFMRVARIRPDIPLVFVSSGGTVYGRNCSPRISESAPLEPIAPYGLGKCLIEQCLTYCGAAMGQSHAILRVTNPIGQWHRSHHQGLVSAAIRAIRTQTPLTVYGDGSAVRDYVDADDVADAILAVASATERLGGAWNVSSGIGRSIIDIVGLVGEVAGRMPELSFQPARPVDVPRAVLDATLIERDFGWKAKTDIRVSIRNVLESSAAPAR